MSSLELCECFSTECEGQQSNIAIVYPPRSGGTTTAIDKAVSLARKGILYLNNKHMAISHAVHIFSTRHEDLVIYHLAGTEKTPDGKIQLRDIHYEIKNAKSSYTTPHNLNERIKEYRQLSREFGSNNSHKKLVELQFELIRDNANVICTVPQIAIRIPDELLNKFDTLIIDEDITLLFFTPTSATLFEYIRNNRKGEYYHKLNVEACVNALPDDIKQNYPEFEEWVKKVTTVVKDFEKHVDQYRNSPHPEKTALTHVKIQLQKECKPPYTNLPIDERLRIAEDVLTNTYRSEEEYEAVKLFVASLFYCGYTTKTTKEGGRIDLVTYEFKLLFRDLLNRFKYIIVRVNSEFFANMLFKQLGKDYKVIKQDEFKYKDNFTLFRTDALEYTKLIYDAGVPALHVTARKKDANKLEKLLKQKGVKEVVTVDRSVSSDDIREWINQGKHIITYCNSSISRGIDLPLIDVCIVWNTYFSAPFYELLSNTLQKDYIYKAFVNAELQQTVLRIAPVIGHKERQPKFIVFDVNVKNKNLPVFRYLHNDVIDVKPNYLAEITRPICPKTKKETNIVSSQVLEQLGVSKDNGGSYYSNFSYIITPPDKNCALFRLLVLTCLYELRKRVVSERITPYKLQSMYNVIAGNTYNSKSELRDILRKHGFKRNVEIDLLIEILRHLGLLDEIREGRRVKCTVKPPEALEVLVHTNNSLSTSCCDTVYSNMTEQSETTLTSDTDDYEELLPNDDVESDEDEELYRAMFESDCVYVTVKYTGEDEIEIAGVDGKNYILKPNQVVELPYENAKILIDNGVAEIIVSTTTIDTSNIAKQPDDTTVTAKSV